MWPSVGFIDKQLLVLLSYLGRKGWPAPSSASHRCWWPHTHTFPGPTPRSAQSAGLLFGNHKQDGRGELKCAKNITSISLLLQMTKYEGIELVS